MGQIALPYDDLKTAILVLRDVQVQGRWSVYLYLSRQLHVAHGDAPPHVYAGNTGSSFLCPLTRQEDSILLQSSLQFLARNYTEITNSYSENLFLLFICPTGQ